MAYLHALILGVLGLSLLGLGVNLIFLRSLRAAGAVSRGRVSRGRVSILVPARDEERSIGECVDSLLGQDYPDFELVVLDDGSTDGTGALVKERFGNDPRRRLIQGAALPEGWIGKNWACHQLSEAATGEWLLFTDADTVHSAGAVSAAVSMAIETRADLLSAWPRLITRTPGERLVIPVLHIPALCWFPIAGVEFLQDHPRLLARIPGGLLRSMVGANGQFVLFRRESYLRIGGHRAVRDHIVEDLALGREIGRRMREGMRLVNCDASRMIDCRMYRSFREVWDGFTKNARAAFEDRVVEWCLVGGLQFAAFFLPFVLVFFRSQFRLAVVEICLIYLIRVILTVRMRTSWVGCVLHPMGHLLALAIGLRSWILTAGTGVEWKGRSYRPSYSAKG
ncbi:MAG: glycosyltransferase [Chthoniobacteraceae bacterium]